MGVLLSLSASPSPGSRRRAIAFREVRPYNRPMAKTLKVLFHAALHDPEAKRLVEIVRANPDLEHLWVGIQCMGGAPPAAAMVFEFLHSLKAETHGHALGSVYSAGTTLFLAFKHRTVSPTATVGIHAAKLTGVTAADLDEIKLQDLLGQVISLNKQLAMQVNAALGVPLDVAEKWVRESKQWRGEEIIRDKIAATIERPIHLLDKELITISN